ncbi:ComEC/Rec2 family competence protein [Leptothrix discophora]|uniref:ComEC/Rec2 family competence protein n=1 Tax=Leptothrix discophora TaxID=89 RepID=A0ABT9G299_LEPDI|nr:ComEC/Rec2 family competence protein [Leptothrix discophora]MDP4300536.1 ComEC/Rec2 family competence protein [Leptothrix discophora]
MPSVPAPVRGPVAVPGPAHGLPLHLLAALAGLGWQLQQARLLSLAERALLLVAIVLIGWGLRSAGAWRRRHPRRARALALLAAALAGWLACDLRAGWRLDDRLDPALDGRVVMLTGVVRGLPVQRPDGARAEVEIEAASVDGRLLRPGAGLPQRLWLAWHAPLDGSASAWGAMASGQRWRWPVRLRAPRARMNPHLPDGELWLFERGLRATATVRERAGRAGGEASEASEPDDAPVLRRPHRLSDEGTSFDPLGPIDRWRDRVRRAIRAEVGDRRQAGLLAGLVIGDQASVVARDWVAVRATGTAHLLAVSGLHLTMWALIARALADRLWRRSRRAMRAWPAPRAARWIGLFAALLYALACGWGVPAQRTLLMLATWTWLRDRAHRWPAARVLICGAAVVLALDPWAALQAGFWLSFVAVGLLMAGGEARGPSSLSAGPDAGESAGEHAGALPPAHPRPPPGPLRRSWDWLRADARSQWIASIGLAPWTLIFFNQVAPAGLLANAVAIPVVTLLLTPLALAGLVWPACWSLAGTLAAAGVDGLALLAATPLGEWHPGAAPPGLQAMAALGAAAVVAPLPAAVRLTGALMALTLLMPPLARPPEGEFELIALDVGQGQALLVRTARHVLLYDTGPAGSAVAGHAGEGPGASTAAAPAGEAPLDAEPGERLLLPLLDALGHDRIDRLVLSHRDTDHTGGALALLRTRRVQHLLSSLEAGHPLRRLAPHQPCTAGLRWRWDGVDFELLHPTGADLVAREAGRIGSNAVSCVLRVRSGTATPEGRRTLLLTGDIERRQELALIDRATASPDAADPASLRADLMLVPHHGSRTSSTDAWLDAVRPRLALVQAGHLNRYGHPAADVMARYRVHGIGVIRTDRCGAWHWRSAHDDRPAPEGCERLRRHRYWHAPIEPDAPAVDGLEFANPLPSNRARP